MVHKTDNTFTLPIKRYFMRKVFTLLTILSIFSFKALAQQDTTRPIIHSDTIHLDTSRYDIHDADTIKIGRVLFIKIKDKNKDTLLVSKSAKKNGITTSWFAFDLGFSNYNDQTNYSNASSYLVNSPGQPALGEGDFKPRLGKSINVNIWFVMQQLPIIRNNLYLKYGLGVELNNYRFKSDISYKENGQLPFGGGMTNSAFVFRDSVSFSKNKLALDYLTVPLMLNLSPNNSKLNLSVGVSAGYLYSQRNKQISDARGKEKNKGDYDFEKFKLSYVGEIGLGSISLYGSYSPKTIYERNLNVKPFNVGFRFNFL